MEPSGPESVPAPAEARQRWRVVHRRRLDAPQLSQREQLTAWEASLAISGLPLVGHDLPVPRPRLVFAAALAIGVAAERELMDLFLVERRAVAEVRVRLAGSLPAGYELVEVHDVWLGEPPLSGQVVAADYRVTLDGAGGRDEPERAALEAACARLLEASTLSRTREKGGRPASYDLRPLVADIGLTGGRAAGPGPGLELRMRTRFDPERGVGRPEEVLGALSELAGLQLTARAIVRERVLLAAEI